jgi:hypothetical protein
VNIRRGRTFFSVGRWSAGNGWNEGDGGKVGEGFLSCWELRLLLQHLKRKRLLRLSSRFNNCHMNLVYCNFSEHLESR